jgi:mannose-6-phosphate isomerase-like protein (cupin superfamily)
VTVEKGECLLIPEGWWHAVEGNDGEGKEEDDGEMRISVNFWFR